MHLENHGSCGWEDYLPHVMLILFQMERSEFWIVRKIVGLFVQEGDDRLPVFIYVIQVVRREIYGNDPKVASNMCIFIFTSKQTSSFPPFKSPKSFRYLKIGGFPVPYLRLFWGWVKPAPRKVQLPLLSPFRPRRAIWGPWVTRAPRQTKRTTKIRKSTRALKIGPKNRGYITSLKMKIVACWPSGFFRPVLKHGPRSLAHVRALG